MTNAIVRHLLPIAAAFLMMGQPASAQIREIDPNQAIDADLGPAPDEQRLPDDAAAPTYNPYDVPAEDNVLMNGQTDPDSAYQGQPLPPPPMQADGRPPCPPLPAGRIPIRRTI